MNGMPTPVRKAMLMVMENMQEQMPKRRNTWRSCDLGQVASLSCTPFL